ncbi:uncharacterized protein LOC113051874 isoform X1 [Carassius auratus]|uniref:Uncharacterized protein LOC113051874 isoform X1 n=1 Tax=Carassius auratus TaxID=7957 RepID=A0A6P6KHM7_CARAU|nr:uncharacterized protein LOC113051874 isoform X1 [Carassius auratus]
MLRNPVNHSRSDSAGEVKRSRITMPYQFAIYYFIDKTVKVESASLIGNSANLSQVTSQPDLDSDDNWIEIKWPTRKEPDRTVPAKVLLLGDSFKDLVTKKNLFILGKDIWTKEECRGVIMKKKMLETNAVEAKKAKMEKQTKIKETAKNQMLQNLKVSLSKNKNKNTQDQHNSEATEEEFPQQLYCQAKTLKAARPKSSTPDDYTSSDDDATVIRSPNQPDIGSDMDEGLPAMQHNQLMDYSTGQQMAPQMDEIMASLRELPEMIKIMKECVHCIKSLKPSFGGTPSSTTSSFVTEVEMQPLAGSEVSVPKRAFQRLNRTRMTIFAQELAVLVFTKDVLAQSTLTGKSGKGAPPKTQLDVAKVQAITDAVLLEFPQSTASDVRAAIRRKCNNEQFVQKKV